MILIETGLTGLCRFTEFLNLRNRAISLSEQIVVSFYPQKRTVDIGAFATFNCSVTGHPIEEVKWYKNAQPLDEDERVTVYANGTMVVAGMHRNDRGMYQCVASNPWETEEATMQLSLGGMGRPQFYLF